MPSIDDPRIQTINFVERATYCKIREIKLVTEVRKSTKFDYGPKALKGNSRVQSAITIQNERVRNEEKIQPSPVCR